MNPGKLVDPYRIEGQLAAGRGLQSVGSQTHFKFPDDNGSFAHAALRCVGVGKCRRENGKGHQDTMCPSYMVTHEEMHSTRGRTHLLWEMMNGEVIRDGWRDEHIKEALDLCLACKGCKGDCPVNVDMATYKAEFLAHYWEGRVRPISAYAFGWIDKWARLAAIAPGFANLFTHLPGLSAVAKAAQVFRSSGRFPRSHRRHFKPGSANHAACPKTTEQKSSSGRIHSTTISCRRLRRPLWKCSGRRRIEVEVLQQHLCCGRPLYDYGFLDMAKSYFIAFWTRLRPYIEAGTPMVVLEPSCCSVFRDEMRNLLPESPAAQSLGREHIHAFGVS